MPNIKFSGSFRNRQMVFFLGENSTFKNHRFEIGESNLPAAQRSFSDASSPIMIDHSPQAVATAPQVSQGAKSLRKVASCFTPWVFMEFRDLFGDQSAEGNFKRLGCIHGTGSEGQCLHGKPSDQTVCWESRPEKQIVHVPSGCNGLPRELVRGILQSGDQLILQFEQGATATLKVLTETAHILRKLRNTGIDVTVSGLSTPDRTKLTRLEWAQP